MSRGKLFAGAVVAGVVVARRRRAAQDAPYTPMPIPTPPPGRTRTVTTRDGVALHVTERGPVDAPVTLVLAHGYCLDERTWDAQVADLVASQPDLRVVTYDQRGHGRSGRTARKRATIAQLGEDLAQLLDEVVPTGQVVLAGHSMGGMTLMALAEQHPERFGDRIAGVGLVATSPGRLAQVTYGLNPLVAPLAHKLIPLTYEKARKDEAAGKRRRPTPKGFTTRLLFGPGADPDVVAFTLRQLDECPAETMAYFHPTFGEHDRVAALKGMSPCEVVVLAGDRDNLCPIDHARDIADALPHARYVVFPGAGHMLGYERRREVSRHLLELVERATRQRTAA